MRAHGLVHENNTPVHLTVTNMELISERFSNTPAHEETTGNVASEPVPPILEIEKGSVSK